MAFGRYLSRAHHRKQQQRQNPVQLCGYYGLQRLIIGPREGIRGPAD
jgi:hypothetical protein